jgi:Skp family chaperone for outer membrane proteins
MTKLNHLPLAAMVIALGAAPAIAQVAGIAYADPSEAILTAKAFETANQQIRTTYKQNIDQITQRRQQTDTQLRPLITALDTNKDNQLSEAEVQAAQTAKRAELTQIQTIQQQSEQAITQLNEPLLLAQAYALETILRAYPAAQTKVITDKKINVIMSPEAFVYAPDAANVTAALKAELDRTTPTVAITPPANWRPTQQTLQLLQQYQQLVARAAQVRAAQSQQQPPAAAGTTPAPEGR